MKDLTDDEILYMQGLLEQEYERLKRIEEFVGEYDEEFKLGNNCWKKLEEIRKDKYYGV